MTVMHNPFMYKKASSHVLIAELLMENVFFLRVILSCSRASANQHVPTVPGNTSCLCWQENKIRNISGNTESLDRENNRYRETTKVNFYLHTTKIVHTNIV